MEYILVGILMLCTLLNNLTINSNFKILVNRLEKQEEILKRIEEKRENFKNFQSKIEELKEKELKLEQLEKASEITINPIGFTNSTVENTIESVNKIYAKNGLNVTYNEVIEYIKLE